jgi:hypothetical protein
MKRNAGPPSSRALVTVRALSGAVLATMFLIQLSPAQMEFKRPKPLQPLPNPSVVGATRDDIVRVTKQMLETREIPLDKEDCGPTSGECTLVSKSVVFIKGIPTKSQLQHYCEVPKDDVRNWARGRYVLRVLVTPASTRTAQVGVYARFEGMINSVSGTEWIPLPSRGELEDQMLRCIMDRVQGGDCKDIFK